MARQFNKIGPRALNITGGLSPDNNVRAEPAETFAFAQTQSTAMGASDIRHNRKTKANATALILIASRVESRERLYRLARCSAGIPGPSSSTRIRIDFAFMNRLSSARLP